MSPTVGDTGEERGRWDCQRDFLFSCIGCCCNATSYWQYPNLVYTNQTPEGGGSFFIAYTIMLIVVGFPMLILEMAVGQYSGHGVKSIGLVAPLCTGVSLLIIGQSLFKFVNDLSIFRWVLSYLLQCTNPSVVNLWNTCNGSFNTENCYNLDEARRCLEDNHFQTFFNGECYNRLELPKEVPMYTIAQNRQSPNAEYFLYSVLGLSGATQGHKQPMEIVKSNIIFEWGDTLYLLCVAVIILTFCNKGIKFMARGMIFLVPISFLLLLSFVIYMMFNVVDYNEIITFFKPNRDVFYSSDVWLAAVGEVLCSLCIARGTIMTLASFNRLNHNFVRTATIVVVVHLFYCFCCGLLVFACLSDLAIYLRASVFSFKESGFTMAFVYSLDAMQRRKDFSTSADRYIVWKTYFMIFFLSIIAFESLMGTVLTLTTAVTDFFPRWRKHYTYVIAGVCLIGLVVTILFALLESYVMMELLHQIITKQSAVLSFLELILFLWIYGASVLLADIKLMINLPGYYFWWFQWKINIPYLLLILLVYDPIKWILISTKVNRYKKPDQDAESWKRSAIIFISITIVIELLILFGSVGFVFYRARRLPQNLKLSWKEFISKLLRPSADWQPAFRGELLDDIRVVTAAPTNQHNL